MSKSLFSALSVALLACSSAIQAHPGHSHAPKKPVQSVKKPASTPSKPVKVKTQTLGEKDANLTFPVAVGEEIVVKLPSNASTGYAWVVARTDAKILPVQGKSEYIAPAFRRGFVGAPGTQVWRFKALKPGKTQVELQYLRSWEKVAPAKTWKANFEVR